MGTDVDHTAVAERLLAAFNANDIDAMRAVLAVRLIAYVTNRDGGSDRIDGRDAYLARVAAMDLAGARFTLTLTQPPVVVDADQVLLMVEVHAVRAETALHNVAAHLMRIADGQVAEWWMVEAKPMASDEFWS